MYQKLIVCVGLLSSVAVSDAFAVDVLINFERASNPRAVEGAFATDLYADVGVRFPTSPRIKRNDLIAGQGLAQSADERCPGPLEIAIDSALGVRAVRLDVINRHMKYYAVEALAGTDPVARSQYFPGDIPPLPDRSRRVSLEAAAGAPDITRVVVDPPADCFDWAQIDNLTLDARNPPSVTNYVWVAAYEITQGVMPALTYLPDSGRVFQAGKPAHGGGGLPGIVHQASAIHHGAADRCALLSSQPFGRHPAVCSQPTGKHN